MSSSEIVVDEQALLETANTISNFSRQCRENFESAIRKIKTNSNDWNDEDFNRLLSAVNSFMSDVDNIDEMSSQLIDRINNKIASIHELRNIKI